MKESVERAIFWWVLMVALVMFWGLLIVTLFGCGEPCSCVPDQHNQMLSDVADSFVALGYPRPCCEVHFCEGTECPPRLDHCCGMTRFDGDLEEGCCKGVWIDTSHDLSGCDNPTRTLIHEWLHEVGYRHGPEMYAALTEIQTHYNDRATKRRERGEQRQD